MSKAAPKAPAQSVALYDALLATNPEIERKCATGRDQTRAWCQLSVRGTINPNIFRFLKHPETRAAVLHQ